MENYDKKVMLKLAELEDDVSALKFVNQKNKLSAGNGITIQNNQISADTTTLATKAELAQKQNTLLAGENITIENNVISASGGSCNCESDIASLQDEQTQQKNSLKHTQLNFDYVKKYLSNIESPIDVNYNPQTYVPETQGTIFKTYADFNRKYNKQFSKTLTTPNMIFSADNNCSGTLLVKVNFTANKNFNGTITIYNNNVSIFSEQVEFSNENLTFEYEKTLSNITCSAGNMFYVKIVSSISATIIMKNCYAKLTANNAEVINQISPFNVEYFNGKYYITDCSSGTAKIAEIAVNDMKNMYCLDWQDTGVECWKYGVSFKLNKVGNNSVIADRIDYYQSLDDKVHLDNITTGQKLMHPTFMLPDWSLTNSNYVYYLVIYSNYSYAFTAALELSTSNVYNFNKKYLNYVNCCAHKYKDIVLSGNLARQQAIMTKSDGSIYADYMSANTVTELQLGFGTNCHSYYANVSSPISLVAFAKHYNKILKYDYNYNANTSSFGLDGITQIGEYDEYFDGVNNDYFVVKNNKLFYYKKPNQ